MVWRVAGITDIVSKQTSPYQQTVGELKKPLKHNKYPKMVAYIYDPETKSPVGGYFLYEKVQT